MVSPYILIITSPLRFAVMDKHRQVCIKNLANEVTKKLTVPPGLEDICYAGTGSLLLRDAEGVSLFDIQQKRSMGQAKISKCR